MLRTFAIVAFATLALSAQSARAETYWLGGSGPRAWWFVDADTVDRSGPNPQGSILSVYRDAGPTYMGKRIGGARSLLEADCRDKKMRYRTTTQLDLKGGFVAETKGGDAWMAVAPRTPGEAQLNYLCGYGQILGREPLAARNAPEIFNDWAAGKPKAEPLKNIGG